MPTFTKGQGGQAILAGLKTELGKLGGEMKGWATRRDVPTEYRTELMRDTIVVARQLRTEAEQAFREWTVEEVADAQRRYRNDPVASAAEETRRNTIELRLGRIVEGAKAEDTRLGARIPAGGVRPVTNASAWSLADRAEQAYMDGDYDTAQLYARAAMELGGPDKAQRAYAAAQGQLDQEHPTRRQALKDIAGVEYAVGIFDRDTNAAFSSVLRDAAVLAQAVGDVQSIQKFGSEAAKHSMAAKMAEFARSQATGTPYEAPVGALAERPLDLRSQPKPGIHRSITPESNGQLVEVD